MSNVIPFPRLRAMPLITAEQIAVKDALASSPECKHCRDTGWHVWTSPTQYFREPCPCGCAACLNDPEDPDYPGAA